MEKDKPGGITIAVETLLVIHVQMRRNSDIIVHIKLAGQSLMKDNTLSFRVREAENAGVGRDLLKQKKSSGSTAQAALQPTQRRESDILQRKVTPSTCQRSKKGVSCTNLL